MKILIVGSGAIGSVLGGFIHKAGGDVTLAGRGEHIRAIKSQGLHITGIWGEYNLKNIKSMEPREALNPDHRDQFDTILMCVKSYDTGAAIKAYMRLLKKDGICVSFQNGMGNMETIAQAIGDQRTGGARVIFGSEIVKPGHVNVTVYADQIVVGPYKLEIFQNKERLYEIASVIDKTGIPSYYMDDVYPHLWAKMFYNCPLNPLGAILRLTYGELIKHEEIKAIMNEIVKEAFAAAKGIGVNLPFNNYTDFMQVFYDVLVPSTAGHRASMLQDIEKGKKTEIDAINGAVVMYGERLGISVEINKTMVRLIKALEKQ
ncbi:MAG: 2-dehydropantoate 2-reductase [Deltaproteobacteria bacterium]|nr:2-dehydropantoate 2-reductase [Deltaproteobacteria bacterium]MCL5792499.1 2-dehydropantoate 2-reductase [Deltaproteobacteria bacterium]